MEAGFWSGPNDEYLVWFRPVTSKLFSVFQSNVYSANLVIGVVCIASIPSVFLLKQKRWKFLQIMAISTLVLFGICSFGLLMAPLG
jgi:hypothetical protein